VPSPLERTPGVPAHGQRVYSDRTIYDEGLAMHVEVTLENGREEVWADLSSDEVCQIVGDHRMRSFSLYTDERELTASRVGNGEYYAAIFLSGVVFVRSKAPGEPSASVSVSLDGEVTAVPRRHLILKSDLDETIRYFEDMVPDSGCPEEMFERQ
jgi:hypothetical protein